MAEQAKPASEEQVPLGCGLVVLILILIAATAMCSKDTSQSNSTGEALNSTEAVAQPEASKLPPLEPLSRGAAKLGYARLKLVYGAEGATGALIYSRNCYDSLAHAFSWGKLDQCGAFDMAAVERVGADDGATSEQSSYFGPEAAAGRYLGAATGAGEPADDADQRLAAVQAHVPKIAAPKPAAADADGATLVDQNGMPIELNAAINEVQGE